MRLAVLNPVDGTFKKWVQWDGEVPRDPEWTRPIQLTVPPVPGPGQKLVERDPVITANAAVQVWEVVQKTREDLDAEAAAADLQAVKGILQDMRDGVGTAGERIMRVERVLFRVAKDVLLTLVGVAAVAMSAFAGGVLEWDDFNPPGVVVGYSVERLEGTNWVKVAEVQTNRWELALPSGQQQVRVIALGADGNKSDPSTNKAVYVLLVVENLRIRQ